MVACTCARTGGNEPQSLQRSAAFNQMVHATIKHFQAEQISSFSFGGASRNQGQLYTPLSPMTVNSQSRAAFHGHWLIFIKLMEKQDHTMSSIGKGSKNWQVDLFVACRTCVPSDDVLMALREAYSAHDDDNFFGVPSIFAAAVFIYFCCFTFFWKFFGIW